jgi:hypothetical protein
MLSVKRKIMLTTLEKSYIEGNPGIDSIMFFCQLVSQMFTPDNCWTWLTGKTLALLSRFPLYMQSQ